MPDATFVAIRRSWRSVVSCRQFERGGLRGLAQINLRSVGILDGDRTGEVRDVEWTDSQLATAGRSRRSSTLQPMKSMPPKCRTLSSSRSRKATGDQTSRYFRLFATLRIEQWTNRTRAASTDLS